METGRLLLACALAILMTGSAAADGVPARDAAPTPHAFEGGLLAAGTYALDIQPATIPISIPAFLALSIDGRVIGTEAFGPTARESTALGTWKTTGLRSIRAQFLSFAYDGDDNFVLRTKVNGDATFDRRFRSGTLTGTFATYSPDQDPLEPSSMPLVQTPFVATMRRVDAD